MDVAALCAYVEDLASWYLNSTLQEKYCTNQTRIAVYFAVLGRSKLLALGRATPEMHYIGACESFRSGERKPATLVQCWGGLPIGKGT
jgi:hypothetical protein